MKLLNKIGIGALVAVTTAATTFGIAQSAIPNSTTGEFTLCVANYTGAVKVVDKESGATCGLGFTEKTFNQAGPQGPQGVPGAQGPAGPAGSGIPVFLHTVDLAFAWGTPRETRWVDCPSGSVSVSASGSYIYPTQHPGWPVTINNGVVQFTSYSDTGASFEAGNPDRSPDYVDAGPVTYHITLKCQEV